MKVKFAKKGVKVTFIGNGVMVMFLVMFFGKGVTVKFVAKGMKGIWGVLTDIVDVNAVIVLSLELSVDRSNTGAARREIHKRRARSSNVYE